MNTEFMKRRTTKITNQNNIYDLIIIGAGAAGLMAGATALSNGKKVLIFERNEKLGRKVRITGKGRCNVTNNCDVQGVINATVGNGRFLYSALNNFSPEDTMNFFENLGVPLKTERGNRVFPVSDNAHDIADALEKSVKNAVIVKKSVTKVLTQEGKITGVMAGAEEYKGENVLIATGGVSYKATGSTGDGYKFAKELGHTVIAPRPSLVAVTSPDKDCGEMQGLALKNCGLKLIDTKKKKATTIYEDFGELLFTHFGISGPTVLSASTHMREMEQGRYKISLDIKPALTEEQLDLRIIRDLEKNNNKNFANSLGELLPQKMIDVIINRSGIDGNKKCNSITREERKNLVNCLKNFNVDVDGFRSMNEAIVTAGGVSTKEINPKTMESKIIEGLYFAGEVVDVDAYTGGFNLQIAFATGFLVGETVSQKYY